MSHRVTTQTEIKDKNIAKKALTAANMDFRESGSVLNITSGPLSGAYIDLTSGEVVGDTDTHNKDTLGMLRQVYGEEKYRSECVKQGVMIESRRVDAQTGDILLMCALG